MLGNAFCYMLYLLALRIVVNINALADKRIYILSFQIIVITVFKVRSSVIEYYSLALSLVNQRPQHKCNRYDNCHRKAQCRCGIEKSAASNPVLVGVFARLNPQYQQLNGDYKQHRENYPFKQRHA